jgi:hypothetical protein
MSAPTGRFLLSSVVIALVAGLLFVSGLPGEFVFDDIPSIVNNSAIHLSRLDPEALINVVSTRQISGDMRTLPTLTFALDFWRGGGLDPATFKITNILLHAITACVLAWLFRSLLLIAGTPANKANVWAPVLAFAWAAHPLQVSSVLYVVQRFQTMGTLFLLLALWAYVSARRAQIEGRSGRTGLLVAGLLWALALGCKEDSILLPAYTLAVELTLLRFAAADADTAKRLRYGYLAATLAGAAVYLFYIVPQHWSWESYAVRDFSTPERLLTQARVLCMYLWQIVLPLPQHMPFYYDWLQPSRGLLHPWTTLLSIVLLAGLLAAAWWQRKRAPLFSLGVFVFFSAHALTSNVIGLELVFEHRNHFALIGAVLAIGSALAGIARRWPLRPAVQATICGALLIVMAGATVTRAYDWRSNLTLAQASAEDAPTSARAWFQVCVSYFQMGGGPVYGNTHLDEAIAACQSGARLAPGALNNPGLLIVLKALKGDDVSREWAQFQQRLGTVRMTWENRRAPIIFMENIQNGVTLDKQQVLTSLATMRKRTDLDMHDLAAVGYFVMNDLSEPEQAIPYFTDVIKAAPPGHPFPWQLGAELREKGRPDLAEKIERLGAPWSRPTAAPVSDR